MSSMQLRNLLATGLRRMAASTTRRSCPAAMSSNLSSLWVNPSSATTTNTRRTIFGGDAAAATTSSGPPSGGDQLAALATEWPHVDVVRYQHKNRTWTLNHVNYYSEALAIGFLETGLQPGDVVLSWLPAHFSETMALQFACSKAGLVLYSLDPELAVTDPTAAKEALAKALTLTNANVLISQEAGSDVPYVKLAEEVIPELQIFETDSGMPFVTPRFPHLRFCLQTGFDQDDKHGWFPFKYFLVPSDNLDEYTSAFNIDASTPLAGELIVDAAGMPTKLGPTKSHAQIVEGKLWPTYTAILEKNFHTVEGIGVIF